MLHESDRPREAMRAARGCARAGVVMVGLTLAASLGCPGAAIAEEVTQGRTGSTKVTVTADNENLRFRVPTVIPFVAASDGTLTGPSPEATRIENLSAFGLKVTNVRVEGSSGWTHSSDVNGADNSIDWVLGPQGAQVSAAEASKGEGTAISDAKWNMTYQSDSTETDDILLYTSGTVGRVTQDISSPVHIGTVTFTLAAGAHAQSQANDVAQDEPTPEAPTGEQS